MNPFSILCIGVALSTVLSLAGCQQQETASPETGRVTATEAYLEHFGTPPQGKEGEAFARVIYLPLQGAPEKVRALPVFLFSEEGQLQKILDRQTGGALVLPADSALYHPFPEDLAVVAATPENGSLSLELTTQLPWDAADQGAAGLALAETALQFPEIRTVHIRLNGEDFMPMPEGGYEQDNQRLAEVVPPTLVFMAGMWEKGAEAPEELLVEFDRPVEVRRFQLTDAAGNKVEGEYFTSVFEMAVVILPQDPARIREGMTLRAEWEVVDQLGRTNKGTSTLPLQRFNH